MNLVSPTLGGDKYLAIRDSLETGDLVLFSGKNAISWSIRKYTRSRFSHVGMVVRPPGTDLYLIWESTWPGGAMIRGLAEVIRSYDGEVFIRRATTNGKLDENSIFFDVRRELGGRAYERSWTALAAAGKGFLQDGREDLSSLFCSELVAETYQRFGWLDDDGSPSDKYVPGDFEPGGIVEGEMAYMQAAHLEPEVILVKG